jgi:hypothetical protein
MTEAKNISFFDLAGKRVYVAAYAGMVGGARAPPQVTLRSNSAADRDCIESKNQKIDRDK